MLRDRNGRSENSSEDSALRENTAKVDRCRARGYRLVERFKNLRSDLIAGPAYRRPKVHMEVLRATREARGHRLHPTLEDTGRDPTPAGVYRGDGSATRIHEEDGHTIRNRDRNDDPGHRGGMPIACVHQMWIIATLRR